MIGATGSTDPPGHEQRLTGAAEWFWYIAAAVGYVGFGIWHKWLLNWLLGPIWLVTVVTLGPAVVRRITQMFDRTERQ